MFDSKTTFTGRLTDAVDLLIDFATLGEYGLEPVGRTSPSCEKRHRTKTGPWEGARNDKGRPSRGGLKSKKKPAATYSPRGLPPKYHRR
jgi:hypothetical protein